MRTDSTNLSKDAMNQCKSYIENKFGKEYYQYRIYSKNQKMHKKHTKQSDRHV